MGIGPTTPCLSASGPSPNSRAASAESGFVFLKTNPKLTRKPVILNSQKRIDDLITGPLLTKEIALSRPVQIVGEQNGATLQVDEDECQGHHLSSLSLEDTHRTNARLEGQTGLLYPRILNRH